MILLNEYLLPIHWAEILKNLFADLLKKLELRCGFKNEIY